MIQQELEKTLHNIYAQRLTQCINLMHKASTGISMHT